MKTKRTLRRTSKITRQYLKLLNDMERTVNRLKKFADVVSDLEADSKELAILRQIHEETLKRVPVPDHKLTDRELFVLGSVDKK